jgi:hypothetical protein
LKKQVIWEYNEFANVLEYCVRNTGYMGDIKITFPVENDCIYVYSSNEYHKLSHNKFIRILCFISCLWVIFLPIYVWFRKRNSNRIVADYQMNISKEEAYSRNYYHIQSLVRNRVQNSLPIKAI